MRALRTFFFSFHAAHLFYLEGHFQVGSPFPFQDVVLRAFDGVQTIVQQPVVESVSASAASAAAAILRRLRHFEQRLRQLVVRHVMTFDAA